MRSESIHCRRGFSPESFIRADLWDGKPATLRIKIEISYPR